MWLTEAIKRDRYMSLPGRLFHMHHALSLACTAASHSGPHQGGLVGRCTSILHGVKRCMARVIALDTLLQEASA